MKTISVVYRNRENLPAIIHLQESLEFIFENYVQVKNVFLDELEDDEIIEGDVYLVIFEKMLSTMKNHIRNFNKIVIMTRGIVKKNILEIQKIPPNTNVLVVNDCYESTMQTAFELNCLGLSYINFIPFDEKNNSVEYYNDIQIAITPNEEHLVPKFIKEIINIGYRQIGYDTFVKLMETGKLNLKLVNRNLIAHMNNIVEPNASFRKDYLNSYLKSEMLDKFIFNSKDAILLIDTDYNLVYSNNKLNKLLKIDNNSNENISLIDYKIYNFIINDDFESKLIELNGENYSAEKTTLKLIDQIVGYSVIFKNEKDIRDLEINLKDNLIKKGLYAKYTFKDIIYNSEVMKQCISIAKKASLTNYNILIKGESGTGKELLAQSIHNFSNRSNMPFVAINCAALPESLLESELFGYESGSFTGANKHGKLGLFEQANRGTIFLDEIGDISYNLQSQLLRVIQERQIMRIGSDKLISIDVRIIVATNKNLEEKVVKGIFRNDLYFRLNVIPIEMPPLKNRREDILLICKDFLGNNYSDITKEEKQILINYDWPGNVRELESTSNYYKTLGEFPSYIVNKNNKHLKNNVKTITDVLLQIINENSLSYHGIGRTKLLYELKIKDIVISDAEVRRLLQYLKDQQYIKINLGRSGSIITEQGMEYLRTKKIE
ncbi:MAG: ATPase [Bacillota bacterium]|nr:ATPase [Bacillota bacterium]